MQAVESGVVGLAGDRRHITAAGLDDHRTAELFRAAGDVERVQPMDNRAVLQGLRHQVQRSTHGIDDRRAGNPLLVEADGSLSAASAGKRDLIAAGVVVNAGQGNSVVRIGEIHPP